MASDIADRRVGPGSEAEAADQDTGQRGSLTLTDKVAQRLTLHAASMTAGVCHHAAGLNKITGRDLPHAELSIAANRVTAHVKVAIAWPRRLDVVAREVQRNVAEALTTLAGLVVDRVDVEVAHVSVAADHGRRVQ